MEINSHGVASKLTELKGQDFLCSSDLSSEQTHAILELSTQLKTGQRRIDLGNRVLGLIFTKASTRTRVSFQIAMARLGGQILDLNPSLTQLGRGEPLKDTARVLSRFCDALAIRTFAQKELIEYATWASIPIINALTDLEHPCQALADFLTIKENFGDLEDVTLTYIGDGNNVAHSLMVCGALLGVNVRIASPIGFEPMSEIVNKARSIASTKSQSKIDILNDPVDAVKDSQVLYTDVWSSMGQEDRKLEKEKSFKGFSITKDLLKEADPKAIVLHCLPAHREQEISDEVMEGSASRIFDQAENRLHVQQALLVALLGGL